MYNGVINIYKEKGFTSHDVVAKMRGILKQKKIGHTGTLDPQAEGVLPVCLGNGTKLCDMLTEKRKVYEAVLILGFATDTQDTTGTVIKRYEGEKDMRDAVSQEDIFQAIAGFTGDYDQIPPMYSAVKINGKKLYELAREGKEVERSPRRVNIGSISVLRMDFPRIRIRVDCSKGTYIRTLCHDIGERLGVCGCMEELLRVRSGSFLLEDAIRLDKLKMLAEEDNVSSVLIPVEKMLAQYPVCTMRAEYDKILQNGNKIYSEMVIAGDGCTESKHVRVYDSEGRFRAVYGYREKDKAFVPEKMFL